MSQKHAWYPRPSVHTSTWSLLLFEALVRCEKLEPELPDQRNRCMDFGELSLRLAQLVQAHIDYAQQVIQWCCCDYKSLITRGPIIDYKRVPLFSKSDCASGSAKISYRTTVGAIASAADTIWFADRWGWGIYILCNSRSMRTMHVGIIYWRNARLLLGVSNRQSINCLSMQITIGNSNLTVRLEMPYRLQSHMTDGILINSEWVCCLSNKWLNVP